MLWAQHSAHVSPTIYFILCLLIVENLVNSDPEFKTLKQQNLSLEQQYAEAIRNHVLMWQKIEEFSTTDDDSVRDLILRCVP